MAKETFAKAMEHVFAHEGGYVDHKDDPGGATNMGITIGTLGDWRDKPVSKADVKALTRGEAAEIYRDLYWDTISGDELPAGVDYAVFDFAINSGPKRAAQYLQRVVGVDDDGAIGPITLAATARMDPAAVINALCDARLEFLKGLSTWSTFGKGWERRVKEVRTHALAMAAAEPASAHEPSPAPSPGPTVDERLAALEAAYEGLAERVSALEAAARGGATPWWHGE
jgi:lysozyme family protein